MKTIIGLVLIIITACPAYSSDEVYRDAGAGAFSFLKIDPGARAAALGGTGLLNSGNLAGFTNPAALAEIQSGALSAGHNRWFGDASQSFLAWTFRVNRISCFVGSRFLYVGGLEMRESATSQPVTTFSSWDMAFSAAAAMRLGMFRLGIAVKYIREKIWLESAGGLALDAGVTVNPISGLVLAGALQHLGPSVTMNEEEFRLPATWRLGGRYSLDLPLGRASLSAEVGKPLDNTPKAGCGLEYSPQKWVDIRFGMRFLDDTRNLTAGLGLSAGSWTLDYAYVPTDYAMGTVHRFTLHKSL